MDTMRHRTRSVNVKAVAATSAATNLTLTELTSLKDGKKLVRSASSEMMAFLFDDSDQEVRDGGNKNDASQKLDNCDGVDTRDKEVDDRDKEVNVVGDNLGHTDVNLEDARKSQTRRRQPKTRRRQPKTRRRQPKTQQP